MKTTTPAGNKTLVINSAALTDRGRRRKLNEDAAFHCTEQTDAGQSIGLYMVCDGLGGHQAGEVASRLAVETVAEELTTVMTVLKALSSKDYRQPSHATLGRYIEMAIKKADTEIRHYGQTHPYEAGNMGTTITLALVHRGLAHIANVGDSRAYLWRAGQITQISRDHSVAAELAASGEIDEREIAEHPHSNILCRALGSDYEVDVDLFECDLQPGDSLVLCSDGLWKAFLDREELAHWFDLGLEPADLCWQLVEEAKRRDGSDNISLVIAQVDEISGRKAQLLSHERIPNLWEETYDYLSRYF